MSKKDKKQNIEEVVTDDQVVVNDQLDESPDEIATSPSAPSPRSAEPAGRDDDAQLQQLQQELEELKQNLAVAQDQLRRAVADYHNLEKRVQEGRSELSSWATAGLLKKLLPVLDHLDKALDGSSEQDKASGWFRGVEMSVKQLKQTLKDEGLDEIEADGQFDPSLHEAVDIQEGDNDKILEVAEKGYNLNGKVLRPAKVVVGRKN